MNRTGAVISAKAKGGRDSASLSAYVHLARMTRFAGAPPRGHGHHRSGGDLYRGGDARRAPAAVSSSGGKGVTRLIPPASGASSARYRVRFAIVRDCSGHGAARFAPRLPSAVQRSSAPGSRPAHPSARTAST